MITGTAAIGQSLSCHHPPQAATIPLMIQRPILLLLATFLTLGVVRAGAQTLSADEKELATYKLTMPNVRKVAGVMRTLAEAAAQDPKARELAKLKDEIEALNKKDELTEAESEKLARLEERAQALEAEVDDQTDMGNANTIAEMESRMKQHPAAMKALAAEGLQPREFAKTLLALFQASIVKGFSQGKVDMAKLPAGVNPENIKFIEENEQELAALQAQMQPARKK
jgi:hypothetical protein